jgi:hypothetical protein
MMPIRIFSTTLLTGAILNEIGFSFREDFKLFSLILVYQFLIITAICEGKK